MKKRLEAAEMWLKRRQLGLLGHVLRGNGLERNYLLGIIGGNRAQGTQRLKYMDRIKEILGGGGRSRKS